MDAGANIKELGLLVVGAGWLGSRRAAAATVARGIRLVAVHDVDDALATRVADRHRADAVPDLASGLRRPDVDAVLVATPHADHVRAARRALLADRHVFCEKPLAIDPHDARALAELADERGLRLATGFNHRQYPPVAEALRLVECGLIGPVQSVRAEIGHRASPAFLASWHIDPTRSGGGTLIDNGPHACDLIRRFAGEMAAAKGYVADSLDLTEGCESEAFALFRGIGSRVAELRSSWTRPAGYLTLDVRGREGFLRVETAPWRLTGRLGDGRRVDRRYLLERLRERAFQRLKGCERSLVVELEAFAASIRNLPRLAPTADGWDGTQAAEMVNAVYRAAEVGEEVLIEPPPTARPSRRPLPSWGVA
jgi:predicted dehydrogenase